MNEVETAWLAGLLEGEGCFYLQECPYPKMCIKLAMTDEDVVRRAFETAGIGLMRKDSYVGTRLDGEPMKDQWIWYVGRKAGCEELMRTLLPHMGQRRAAKIEEILAAGEAWAPRVWKHGTRQGYERGCREACCREPHNKRMRDQRAARKES